MEHRIKSADILEQKISVVYNSTTKQKFKILKSGIPSENHWLSADVLSIQIDNILGKLQGLKNWLLNCKMGRGVTWRVL